MVVRAPERTSASMAPSAMRMYRTGTDVQWIAEHSQSITALTSIGTLLV